MDPGGYSGEHREARCVGDDANPVGAEGACHRRGAELQRVGGLRRPAVGPLETSCKGAL